jgi:hypothetical protein
MNTSPGELGRLVGCDPAVHHRRGRAMRDRREADDDGRAAVGLLSVLSTLHDGDIAYFDTDQNTLVQAMCVGLSPEQASQVYWRV